MPKADSDPVVYISDALPDWNEIQAEQVEKIVIGDLKNGLEAEGGLPKDLAERYSKLTSLHLWGWSTLESIPDLPPGLRVLDVRGCASIHTLPGLPESLEELVLGNLPELTGLKVLSLDQLWELRIENCPLLAQDSIMRVLRLGRALQSVHLDNCSALQEVTGSWSKVLERLDLVNCSALQELPEDWPDGLNRIVLRGSSGLKNRSLPKEFPARLDYLDLADAKGLRRLPRLNGEPRTMVIHGSGLELPDFLFGESADSNMAQDILAHLEQKRVVDDQVKVILLGDGRAGKSSLARKFVEGNFDDKEKSTHGIRRWRKEGFLFEPEGEVQDVEGTLDLWDFAGQDLYHNSHRAFYQSQAVFVLCVNCAGPGASPEGDGKDRNHLPDTWDEEHSLAYWVEQVRALGGMGSRELPPPIIVVRTKADRDQEPGVADKVDQFESDLNALLADDREGAQIESVTFSAQGDKDLPALIAALHKAVACVLGPRGRREVGEGVLALKAELQTLKDQNDEAHKATDGVLADPPHPTIERATFNSMVAKHLTTGAYSRKPELVSRLLHTTGFLYEDPKRLGDTLVLDQRWIINGIYTAFDRQRTWPWLVHQGGRCTLDDLQNWGWSAYSEAHQALFLRFMETCGMAIDLGESWSEIHEYLIPRALPSRDGGPLRAAADHRAGTQEAWSHTFDDDRLGRDVALDAIVRLGQRWRHRALLWLYGGQFESYRYRHALPGEDRTLLFLDWQASAEGAYGGKLDLRLYGKDRSFAAAVLEHLGETPGFPKDLIEACILPEEVESKSPADLSAHSFRTEEQGAVASHDPGHLPFPPIEVGISFAGDPKGEAGADAIDSIEAWPLRLAAALRGQGARVEEYRSQGNLAFFQQDPDRAAYNRRVASRSFVCAFLSSKYLRSASCMEEFTELVMGAADSKGVQDRGKCRVAMFPGALEVPGDVQDGERLSFHAYFKALWKHEANQVGKDAVLESGVRDRSEAEAALAISDELKKMREASWHTAVLKEDKRFQRVLDVLHRNQWTLEEIELQPTEEELERWTRELRECLGLRERSWKEAKKQQKEGNIGLAKLSALHWCFCEDPDGHPEGLDQALQMRANDTIMDGLFVGLRDDLERLQAKNPNVTSWQDLYRALHAEFGSNPQQG